MRDVSSWRDEEGNVQENYHTSQKFANILGLVPTSVVDVSDVEFISGWLRNRFERMLVSVAIDETVLPRFLSSPDPNDWEKAIAVLKQCIEVDWIDDGPNKTAKTVIEDYWLKRLVSNHADVFRGKGWFARASAFERQVRVVFSSDIHKEHSTIFRPAIESHAQNHQFREAENIMVEGLRDVLLSWSTHTPQLAMQYTARLISDELEVLRRVGIYVLDKKWDVLAAMYPTVLKSDPFRTGHLHELYNLLKNHFGQVEKNDQAETLRQIRNIPLPSWSETPKATLREIQRRWLSSLVGKGCDEADQWFAEFQADATMGPLPEHIDFSLYMSFWSGPDASPYSASELVGFAEARVLAQQLERFKPANELRGPSLDGLAATLQDAARTKPDTFTAALPQLIDSRPYVQSSVINGLKDAWTLKQVTSLNWDVAWEKITTFVENLIGRKEFWDPENQDRRDWIITAIRTFCTPELTTTCMRTLRRCCLVLA